VEAIEHEREPIDPGLRLRGPRPSRAPGPPPGSSERRERPGEGVQQRRERPGKGWSGAAGDLGWGARPGIAVVGTGSWGITLAIHAARGGRAVTLLARTAAEAAALQAARESPRLPGVPFPPGLQVSAAPDAVLPATGLVLMVVPAQTMRQNVRAIGEYLHPGTIVISASKGLEVGTTRRMSQVIAEELPRHDLACIGALSGPNLAREVASGKPSSSVVACPDEAGARVVQRALMAPHLRVYTSTDLVGVELGGALKNIIALGAGMADGLEVGDNAKAALMTRGLAEITRLGKAAGAQPLTFAGLAGLGDLIATCMSPLSRNRSLGEQLARGRRLQEALAEMRQVAEGVTTTVAALELAERYRVEMPITALMRHVLFHGLPPLEAAMTLMQRDPKSELEGVP
jgi:glycerol-3-phosphate dehydrogenase (NAD(P)+)